MAPMSSRSSYLTRRIEALKDEGWTPDQIDAARELVREHGATR